MSDVVCLRPEADFLSAGITPPTDLSIAYRAPDAPDLAGLLRRARALVLPAVGPALAGSLFRETSLELVQVTGAGLDRLDQKILAEEGIALANVAGGSNAAVSEYVVANALRLMRGFDGTDNIRAGNYAAHRADMVAANMRGFDGTLFGLIGMGEIGQAVAARCQALGAEIAYYDPAVTEGIDGRRLNLTDLLAQSDIVSLHLPLVAGTRDLIGAEELALMKPDALLINAARGGIVDEGALARALERGDLLGAAVDVYSTEPPDADNPLLTIGDAGRGRLILTPHIAGVSAQASRYLFVEAWQNVSRVLIDAGQPKYLISG